MAWRPNSPKLRLVPPLAAPVRLGWCCLRCLTRRGINMAQASPGVVAVGAAEAASVASALGASAERSERFGRSPSEPRPGRSQQPPRAPRPEIGRAPCQERVSQTVELTQVVVSLNKQIKQL